LTSDGKCAAFPEWELHHFMHSAKVIFWEESSSLAFLRTDTDGREKHQIQALSREYGGRKGHNPLKVKILTIIGGGRA
jgi:hypothetical protein